MTDAELIARAAAVNPRDVGGRLFGDVGAALLTDKGNVYGRCLHRHWFWHRVLC